METSDDTAPTPALSARPDDAPSDAAPAVDAVTATSPISTEQLTLALRRVKDPELNLNIVDLGLVYTVRADGNTAIIDMSLTSPGCPSGPEIMKDAEDAMRTVPDVADVQVNLVWSPPWTPDRIDPRVRAYLGF
jgi:metal-sulfur cluster biosynthetic enzyme